VMGIFKALGREQWTVAAVGAVIFLLAGWVLVEALMVVKKVKDERAHDAEHG